MCSHGSYCMAQAGLELVAVLLPQPPGCGIRGVHYHTGPCAGFINCFALVYLEMFMRTTWRSWRAITVSWMNDSTFRSLQINHCMDKNKAKHSQIGSSILEQGTSSIMKNTVLCLCATIMIIVCTVTIARAACQTVCVVELARVSTVSPETATIFTAILQFSDLRHKNGLSCVHEDAELGRAGQGQAWDSTRQRVPRAVLMTVLLAGVLEH